MYVPGQLGESSYWSKSRRKGRELGMEADGSGKLGNRANWEAQLGLCSKFKDRSYVKIAITGITRKIGRLKETSGHCKPPQALMAAKEDRFVT